MSQLFRTTGCAIFAFSALQANAGQAFQYGDLSGTWELAAGAVSINTHGVNFGTGRVDYRTGENDGNRISWQEFYIKPGFTLSYPLSPDFQLLGGASLMATTTLGDGDAGGYTRSSDGTTHWEEGYVGFKTGDWKFTAGRQNFQIGNGFIVMDGNIDALGKGGYWMGARTAFQDSAIVDWSHEAVRAQVFTLRSEDDLSGDYRMTGVNLDVDMAGQGILGATAMQVDSEVGRSEELVPRDGMKVYDIRALGVKVPGLPALTLDGEYAMQRGSGRGGVEHDAKAWYLQGDYAIDLLPVPVNLGYRYLTYSGDDDPSDNKARAWDPLSKGFSGWSTWLVGDVVGNYLLFSSNERVHQYSVKTQFNDQLTLGAIHYQFWLDEDNFYGTPVSDKRFADESVIYLDWTPSAQWYASLSYSWVNAKSAAKEVFGDDQGFNALELYVLYHF